MNQKIKTAGIILTAAVFFIIDRLFKIFFTGIWRRADFNVLGDWLKLQLSYNSGIAFSLPVNSLLIISATGLIAVFLSYFAWRDLAQKKFTAFFALILIIFGAYSNLFDRLKFGAVVDYIYLKHFTVFNLADAMITIGAVILIIVQMKKNKQTII